MSEDNYRGLTITVWDNLQPRAYATFGFNKLDAGETMTVYFPPIVDRKTLHIVIEDNDYHLVRLGLKSGAGESAVLNEAAQMASNE
jgi:hypothetical protein